jgi:hypothetical protein
MARQLNRLYNGSQTKGNQEEVEGSALEDLHNPDDEDSVCNWELFFVQYTESGQKKILFAKKYENGSKKFLPAIYNERGQEKCCLAEN